MRGISVGVTVLFLGCVACSSQPEPAKAPAAASPSPSKPVGTLAQVMRAIYFPNSNIIFDTQAVDPGAPPAKGADKVDGATTTSTFSGIYTGWQVVENAAIALSESADLILLPGRLCQNGKPVPVDRDDFRKYAEGMRAAGIAALEVARTKNLEKMQEVTNTVADACSSCHEPYRDVGDADSPARCMPPTP